MIKGISLFIFLFILTSCSRKILYYNDITMMSSVYGIESKTGYKIYVPETNSYIDDDNLDEMTIRKQDGNDFKIMAHSASLMYDYSFSYKNSIITIKNKNKAFTLTVKKDTIQVLHNLPVPKTFLHLTVSNGEYISFRSNYSYRADYKKDTLMVFNSYQPQLAHLFYLYPITSDSSIGEKIYSNPIKIGFLEGIGIPVFIEAYDFITNRRVIKLNCRDISEVKFATKKGIFKYLK